MPKPAIARARAVAVVLGMVLLFFHRLAFTNLILARGDTFFYFYPYWDYRAQALLAGELPLWNPYLFMGAPFLANPQAGVLYPLNWLVVGLAAPIAVKVTILIHAIIAGVGALALGRRLRLSWPGATLAALLFVCGGHLAAKVEQVNQLQGFAWLPWLLLALDALLRGRRPLWAGWALAGLLALQLVAGHTQTTFISLAGLFLWWLVVPVRRTWRNLLLPAAFLALGALLAAAQLLPTFELAQQSFRSGGLSFAEAVSFSLNPLLLGRALLPGYSRAIFSEFVGYVGVIPLLLAVGAVVTLRRAESTAAFALWRGVAIFALAGLFLALGGFNPVYWALVRIVPGFDLFRAPARWLALWALGAALLAGRGLDQLGTARGDAPRRVVAPAAAVVLALVGLALASARIVPPGESGPLGLPGATDLVVWLIALLIGLTVIYGPTNLKSPISNLQSSALIALSITELFLASLRLPLNNLTAPEAYSSIRPAMTQLLAARDDTLPPARFLSMSALQFDPGDLTEMRGILEPQLPERAVFDAIVAAKAKEVLSPNLPLAWQVPAVDGYDGGVLPLRAYARFAEQFTGDQPSPDGRLREYVTDTPPNWLLNITNTRWLITDKVGDLWIDNVYYDLQLAAPLAPGQTVNVEHMPEFDATAVRLVLTGSAHSDDPVGYLKIELEGRETRRLPVPARLVASGGGLVQIGSVARPAALSITSATRGLTVHGATLVDERTGAFMPLALGPYRLAHSGDVKVYENLNAFPRAYLVPGLPLTPDTRPVGEVVIREYEPNRVVVAAVAPEPAVLVLADAAYPGWRAGVDGAPASIETANGLFRAVRVKTGAHEVAFEFAPLSWRWGIGISAAALVVWLAGAGLALYRSRAVDSD